MPFSACAVDIQEIWEDEERREIITMSASVCHTLNFVEVVDKQKILTEAVDGGFPVPSSLML